jgi:hypothetical protein
VWSWKKEAELRYNYPDKFGRECGKRPCGDGGFHILNEYGECEECGANAFPDIIARTCTKSTCAPFEILTAEGECEECTEPYTYPSQYDGRTCLTQVCSSNFEVLRETGECEECTERFAAPDALKKRECVRIQCSSPYMRLNSQPSCEDCPLYTYPDPTKGRVCQEQPCTALEYLTPAGACEDCMGD